MPSEEQQKLNEQLEALKLFPNNKHVRELRRQIKTKLSKIKQKPIIKPKKKSKRSRSKGLEKYHRYIRLIRNNFPELSYSEIRKQFSHRRAGNEVSVPDVVWRHPSP